jgi:GT2 family glycosyltransferase
VAGNVGEIFSDRRQKVSPDTDGGPVEPRAAFSEGWREASEEKSVIRFSAVIATMNRPRDLGRALQSLAEQTRLPFEVLVVDQSEDHATRETAGKFAEDPRLKGTVRYLFQKEKSLVRARNRGIGEAKGEVLTFLDDDIVLEPDYFEKIESALEHSPEIGVIGGSTIVETPLRGIKWSLRRFLMRLFLVSFFDGRMTPSGFGYPIYEREVRKVTPVEMLHGCNMSFRRSAIGDERFDEWFVGYGFREDAEFSYRLSRKTKIVMIPDARLHHYQSASNRLDVENLKRMEILNYHYVFKKFKGDGVFRKFLFFYSLYGILLADALEFFSKRDDLKRRKLKAGFEAARELFRRS